MMRQRTLALFAIAFSAACANRGARAPDVTSTPNIKVVVFNIHAGKDAGGRPNLDAVADLLRSTDADVALLQEVDRGTNRSGKVDQVAQLATKSGLAPVFGRSLDYDGGQYGIAALSRGGFVANFTEPLPVQPIQTRAGGSHEPRAALVAVARTGIGRLSFLNTHLDASRDESYRLQEVETVLKLMSDVRKTRLPAAAGGDFNAEPGSAVHQRVVASGLRDAWMECGRGDGLTFPADKPVKRIDYLFLADPLQCTDARVIETTISDHRPLLVTLR